MSILTAGVAVRYAGCCTQTMNAGAGMSEYTPDALPYSSADLVLGEREIPVTFVRQVSGDEVHFLLKSHG